MSESGLIYAPQSLLGWFKFAATYLGFALGIYRQSALSAFDKLALFPEFIWHMVRTSHAGFYKYYIKRART